MFIIPYIYKKVSIHPMQITIFQFLTIGGTVLWSESDDLDVEGDILNPNGIYLSDVPIRYKDAYCCPVDTERTAMGDFYKWEEIAKGDKETFCWRTFYVFGEETNYRGWLPIPEQDMLGGYSCRSLMDHLSAC